VVWVDDLNGSGEMLAGEVPDPDGSVPEDHLLLRPAPGFGIEARTELLCRLISRQNTNPPRASTLPATRVARLD
jgi:hypothetical protein